MKLNIEIIVPPSGKKASAPQTRPEVWPTMLGEEEPLFGNLKFEFYDGGTAAVDHTPTRLGDIQLYVAGDQTAEIITTQPCKIYYTADATEKTTGFTILDSIYSAVTNRTTVTVDDTLPQNITKIRTWPEISGWSENISNKGSINFQFGDSCYCHAQTPVKVTTKHEGNAAAVPPSVLSTQYDPSNVDRWDRKPLQTVEQANRDADKRFSGQGAGTLNLRCEIKTGVGTKGDVSPDLIADALKKGQASIVDGNGAQGFQEKFGGLLPAAYGVKVSEVGTKTFGHYWDLEVGGTQPKYSYDFLQPDGICFCWFDTTDSDNFKVTREPSYSADEVSGRFLNPIAGGKIKVFLIPRQWAYYCRLMEPIATTDPQTMEVHTLLVSTRDWPDDMVQVLTWDYTEDPSRCYPDTPPPGDLGSPIACLRTGFMLECEEWNCSVNGGDPALFSLDRRPWSYSGLGCPCEPTIYCGSPPPYENAGCCTGVNDSLLSEALSRAYEITSQGTTHYTHHIGLWWDRLPVNFDFEPPEDRAPTPPYFLSPYPGLESLTLVGDESKDDAIAHLIAAGLTQEDAEALVIGGYSSLHIHQGSPRLPILGVGGGEITVDDRLFDAQCLSRPNGKPLPDNMIKYGMQEVFTNDIMGPIWDKIAASNFWTQFGSFAETGPIVDDIPIGVGISPSGACDLMGIIVVGSQPYYIWRRIGETFTRRFVRVQGDYDGQVCAFEGMQSHCDESSVVPLMIASRERKQESGLNLDGTKYAWSDISCHFSGDGRELTSILVPYTASCVENTFGREELNDTELCWNIASTAPGGISLERTVYAMLGRERAISEEFSPRIYKTGWVTMFTHTMDERNGRG